MEICDDCQHKRGLHDFNRACCVARYVVNVWRVYNLRGDKNMAARQAVRKNATSDYSKNAKELAEFRVKVSEHIGRILETR